MMRNESDTAWKEILDAYFNDFVEYCLPELHELIDWQRQWTALDKELQAITKGADTGKRLLDKLFKVFLKDGREQWVLIHLEVQGTQDDDFPKRMFSYGYRIYDKYQKPIVSCAILTDENMRWRPDSYQVGLAGSYLSAKYLVVKLIDYQDRIEELEASNNPFASVIIAQLAALEVKRKPDDERKRVKFSLTRRLYDKGFEKKGVINLYKFIDWLIGLSSPLELEYLEEIYQLEEAVKMSYISSAERFGRKQEAVDIAKHLLEEGVKSNIIGRATGLSLVKIKKLQQELRQEAKKRNH